MGASAILALALQLLPVIQHGVPQFIAWLQSLRAAAQQAGEWTAEQDAAFMLAIWAKTQDPAYQPDPPAPPAP